MDYELEKLKEEYNKLKSLWDKLIATWEHPSCYEDLYKIYPLLTTTAAISRKYISWNKALNYPVSVIKPSSETGIGSRAEKGSKEQKRGQVPFLIKSSRTPDEIPGHS